MRKQKGTPNSALNSVISEPPGATAQQESARVFFPNLDGLRFIAFFLVYLQHGFGVGNAAGAGVAFFFVLSGFLITYLLLLEVDREGRVDVIAFYIRRALRIWPLYFCVIAFAFVVYPALKSLAGVPGGIQNGGPLLYVLFLANFDVLRVSGLEGAGSTNVLWSVSVEEQFYLVWPLLFRFLPTRYLGAIFPTIIAASFLFRYTHSEDGAILYFHSFSVISDMAIGGLSAYLWIRSSGARAYVRETPRWVILIVYFLGVGFVLTTPLWGPFTRIAAAGFFAFVVLEQNFCRYSLLKMSRSSWLSEWGQYTYGLYMIHVIVLTVQEKGSLLLGLSPANPVYGWIHPPLGLAISLVVAKLSFRYLESPFLKLKGRFARIPSNRALPRPASGGEAHLQQENPTTDAKVHDARALK